MNLCKEYLLLRKLIFIIFIFMCTNGFSNEKELFYKVHKVKKSKKTILFIHGTPGDHEVFKDYLGSTKLKEDFNMISVDRLGFGKSDKSVETNFDTQKDSILKVLDKEFKGEQKITCVGHSYGGPLCLKLSIDHPKRVDKIILIAGVFNPHRKILRWYNKAASTWLIRLFLPRGLKNSNKEMYGIKKELLKLEKTLLTFKNSALLIHGRKDKIVPFKDSDWLSKRLKVGTFEFLKLEEAGHFVLWNQTDTIVKDIINFH